MKELCEMELREVNGGSSSYEKAMATLGLIAVGFTIVGLVATGPVGVAVGIMGGCLDISGTVGAAFHAFLT